MPKFYCEYCGIYLTHSSPSGRGQHAKGRKHINNRIEYYKQVIEDVNKENQDKLKQMQASHSATGGLAAMHSALQFPPSMQSQQQMQMLMQLQHLQTGGISQMQINNKSAAPPGSMITGQPGASQQAGGAGAMPQIPQAGSMLPPAFGVGVPPTQGAGGVPPLRPGMLGGMPPPPHMMGFLPPNMMPPGGPGGMPPMMPPPGFIPPHGMIPGLPPFGQPLNPAAQAPSATATPASAMAIESTEQQKEITLQQ